jgi:hypothetical protein
MLAVSIAGLGLVWAAAWLPAGLLAWAAAAAVLPRLARRQRLLTAGLCGVGAAGIAWGALHGQPPAWRVILAGNQWLLCMLVGASFLQLAVTPRPAARAGRRGRAAVWRTLLGMHLFGAVVNIAAVFLVGDRLSRRSGLPWSQAVLLSRSFSAAAFWSPFFAATAVALTYAPRTNIAVLVPLGACVAAFALALSARQVTRLLGDALPDYQGFPLGAATLAVPVALMAMVMAGHAAFPEQPMTVVIALCAPALTLAVLAAGDRRDAARRLAGHVTIRLPSMGGELCLFLSAGVLTAGLSAAASSLGGWQPLARFGVAEAWVLLVVMVAVSVAGVHPVISIAVAAGLLGPGGYDHTLFALTGLIAWGLVAAGGPLSGLNLVLSGRFGVDTFGMARQNLGYVLAILAISPGVLWLCETLTGTPG